jgi:tRNA(Leu) C34 or U34 (ribose-2'-O)-methylase TrmL
MRGFSCVGLQNPKNDINVGSVLRACGNFNVAMLAIGGTRNRYRKVSADTMKAYRHMPMLQVEDLHSVIPYDCVPIAVDLIDEARCLFNFIHPERAFYIFGPEDGTLGKETLSWCKHAVYIPTNRCMNLAATVHVVLYDRMMKLWKPDE